MLCFDVAWTLLQHDASFNIHGENRQMKAFILKRGMKSLHPKWENFHNLKDIYKPSFEITDKNNNNNNKNTSEELGSNFSSCLMGNNTLNPFIH